MAFRAWLISLPAHIRVGLAMLVTLASAMLLAGLPAYCLGKYWDDRGHFLKNYRAAEWWEAQLVSTIDYAKHSTDANDVIFLGDSTCTVGVRTKRFEELTGLRAYNLTGPGFLRLEGRQFVFEEYLKEHRPPKVLVYAVHPSDFQRSGPWPEWEERRDSFFWAYGPRAPEAVQAHNLTVLRHTREGVRIAYGFIQGGDEHIARSRLSMSASDGPDLRTYLSQLRAERGFVPKQKTWTGKPVPEQPFPGSPEFKELFLNLVRLCRERDILLLIRPMPVVAGTADRLTDDLQCYFRHLERDFQNVLVSRPEVLLYDRSLFLDKEHMHVGGADQFAIFLAKQVLTVFRERRLDTTGDARN